MLFGIWCFIGGLAGTVLMDIADKCAGKLHIPWGGCGGPAALGRWVLGFLKGRLIHQNIVESPHVKNETSVGWVFHYLTGGFMTLTYPMLYLIFGASTAQDHLIPGLVWGLATSAFPWFILFPSFGWGFFGVRAPGNVRPLISVAISHLLYGLGLAIVLTSAP